MISAVALLFAFMLFIVSDASGRIDFVDLIPSKKILTNSSNNPIAVYSHDLASKKVLTFLQPGLSLPHVSLVASNDWNYVNLNGQVASIRSKNVTVTYIVLEKYYLSPDLFDRLYWAALLGSVLSIAGLLGLLVIGRSWAKKTVNDNTPEEFEFDFDYKNQTQNDSSVNKELDFSTSVNIAEKTEQRDLRSDNKALKKATELDKQAELQKKEEQEKKAEEARLAKMLEKEQEKDRQEQKQQEQKKQEQKKQEQKREQQKLAAEKAQQEARKKQVIKTEANKPETKKSASQVPEKHKKETARLRHELIGTANEESKTRYRGEATIVEMRSSYDRLFARYKSVKEEAQAMSLAFDDQKYKNLLSVRGFQIYLVSSLISENKFTILEWIPDKGYGSDTSVESNVSPNLIVQDNRGNVFGLVCKYRASYYLANKEKQVCWASELQSEQYSKFSRSRNMPLYLVIGLRGKYNAPRYNFLVSLDEISKHSKRVNDPEKGFQLAVNCKDIADTLVEKGNYSACLDRKVSEL